MSTIEEPSIKEKAQISMYLYKQTIRCFHLQYVVLAHDVDTDLFSDVSLFPAPHHMPPLGTLLLHQINLLKTDHKNIKFGN